MVALLRRYVNCGSHHLRVPFVLTVVGLPSIRHHLFVETTELHPICYGRHASAQIDPGVIPPDQGDKEVGSKVYLQKPASRVCRVGQPVLDLATSLSERIR